MTAIPIESEADIVAVRREVRNLAKAQGFGLVQETKLVTAASELARNALDHGGGGVVHLDTAEQDGREGVRAIIEDQGPGIPDTREALKDGYSTGAGFGYGLGGARRLVDEFHIDSSPGQGTRITIVRWR